jgi:hypothetical protein
MNSKQMQKYNNKSRYERHLFDPLLDVLTNAEYLTFTAEQFYNVVIPFSRLLSRICLRHILEYMASRNYSLELSTRTVRRLENSIKDGDVALFQFIYNTEYMQPGIYTWFEYKIPHSNAWNKYLFCSCGYRKPNKMFRHFFIQESECLCGNEKRIEPEAPQRYELNFYPECSCCNKESEPIKIHEHLYIQRCNCENGKRYLAFKLANINSEQKQIQEQIQIKEYIVASGPITQEHEILLKK